MTRQDLITRARSLCDELEGKPGYGSPFLWSDLADLAVDEIARLDTVYATFAQDVASGQQAYPLPTVYRVTAIVCQDADGNACRLEPVTPQIMDERFPLWRTAPQSGAPAMAIMQGQQSVLIYPVPDYDQPAGLGIEGYVVPSSGGQSGANMWPDMADTCPLPARAHMMAPFGMAYYRCIQYPTAENAARAPMLKERWEFFKAEFLRELEDSSAATGFGDAPDKSRAMFASLLGAF